MKQLRRQLPILAVLIVLGSLLTYGFWPAPVEVEVVRSVRGALRVTVRDDGETRIREKYVVSAPVDGKLLRLELHAGDTVWQGSTVLARIEPGDPTLLDSRTRAQLEARVRAAEAAQNRSRAMLQHRSEARDLAKDHYNRAVGLIGTRSISQSEFDQTEHQLRIAEADVHSAEFDGKIADFELEQARAALMHTESSPSKSAIMAIRSPISGRVLRVFHEDAGVVAPGSRLLELGDPQDLEMKIDVLSTDAVRIRRGARVFVEQWGGAETLEGRVRLIEPSAFLKISALGIEEKRVDIVADFTTPFEQRESLGDGYRIEARIVVVELDNILKVPAGVLFRDGDAWCLFRVAAGRAERRTVEVGETNGLETRIRDGISEGDQLILYPTDKVRDGIRLRTTR